MNGPATPPKARPVQPSTVATAGQSELRKRLGWTRRIAVHALRDPRWAREAFRRGAPVTGTSGPVTVLTHAEALRENGFTVFRGLFSEAECAALAAEFKTAAGIVEGEHFTKTDATNKIPITQKVLFDERVLNAVRTSLSGDARFLQTSDLHYRHDTTGWHRDSVHRAVDNTDAPDWGDLDGDFGVVKAILYLESDNAAMGLMRGSHLSPFEIDKDYVLMAEQRRHQIVVDAIDEPNRRFGEEGRRVPMAWRALVGDVLVFDQRLYHAGRRVDDGKVTKEREAAKFTLSLVFGLDNRHSDRFYSYFRYARRELGYHAFPKDFRAKLDEHDLVLHNGLGNYYEDHPEELRLASLRKPETMEPLIEEFTRAGQARRAAAGKAG